MPSQRSISSRLRKRSLDRIAHPLVLAGWAASESGDRRRENPRDFALRRVLAVLKTLARTRRLRRGIGCSSTCA